MAKLFNHMHFRMRFGGHSGEQSGDHSGDRAVGGAAVAR